MHEPAIHESAAQGTPRPRPRELAMSAAWNAGLTREVITTTGESVRIIFPGNWTHGTGPDFADAMLDFSERGYASGSVEIHTRSSDWVAHGHHIDTRYNDVILHIVTIDDLPETRRADGRLVPVAILTVSDDILFAIDRELPDIWTDIGGTVCAQDLSKREPARIRGALQRLGDERLREKALVIEGQLSEQSADTVFLELLFDGFGYSENRGPMRQVAQAITRFGVLESRPPTTSDSPDPALVALLLGIGGFLPFSPPDAHAGGILPEDQYRIERAWLETPAAFANDTIPATAWHPGRTRPANHPVARILQVATLLTRCGGSPLEPILDLLREAGNPVDWLREITTRPGHPGLGTGRATAITASVILPFALAWSVHNDEPHLEDAAMQAWTSLRHVEWTRPGKRALRQVTGGKSLRGLGERGHQGLLHLDRTLCTPRRCHECPIAHEVIRDRQR